MIAISILAVLIGILLPALGGARNAARDAVCLSNMHSTAHVWLEWLTDHKYFPAHDDTGIRDFQFTWGGVDWYNDDAYGDQGGGYIYEFDLTRERTMNPYYGAPLHLQHHFDAFFCPRDHGVFEAGNPNERFYFGWEPHQPNPFGLPFQQIPSNAPDDYTLYGVVGNSYRANEWLWIKPGSNTGGWNEETEQIEANGTLRNTINHVEDPSRLAIVGDYANFVVGRMRHDLRPQFWPFAEWHGPDICNIAFLDGSARPTRLIPGQADSALYTFYLQPRRHNQWSWVYGWSNGGTPEEPGEEDDVEG